MQMGWIYGNPESFVVRLVRHMTRFRKSDQLDSPTRQLRVDLRGTNHFEESSAVGLMRLLAPHVKCITDPETRVTSYPERLDWVRFNRDGSGYSANEDVGHWGADSIASANERAL